MKSQRMNRFIKVCAWLLLASAMLSVLLVAAMMQWATPLDGAVLNINGEQFTLAQLHGGQWLLVLGGVMLALLVVLLVLLVVVPIMVLVPLLAAALVLAVALFTALGVAALLLSPLLLLVWIVWRVARGPSPAAQPAATMGA